MTTPIVVEDGTGKTNSNSYVTVDYLTTYAQNSGIELKCDATVLLFKAMRVLDTYQWMGIKTAKIQALQWPRSFYRMPTDSITGYGIYAVLVDGWPVLSNEIPDRLKKAQCEICLAIDSGTDLSKVRERVTKREKYGPVDTEYMLYKSPIPVMPVVEQLLQPFVIYTGNTAKLIRT